MTPDYIEARLLAKGAIYAVIEYGTGLRGEPLYGVTVYHLDGADKSGRDHDASTCHDTPADVVAMLQTLNKGAV